MGFTEAFDYSNAAAIFREYAAQTAFENDGSRDLDLGAFADVTDQDFENLTPFQWPKPHGETPISETQRFFANGGFFTESGKGQFIAVKVSTSANTDDAYFTLNTGRIRDHWHTMTRTAKSPRLSSHIAEPFAEIHPADAATLGIKDADLVALNNALGEIIARALITDRQQTGAVFVPMHWTDQWAANGRIDRLVNAETDPISGQPALKMAHVKLRKFDAKIYGFSVTREKPELSDFDYWALAKTPLGWRTEFACEADSLDQDLLIQNLLGLADSAAILKFDDKQMGLTRAAHFEGSELLGAVYLSEQPVAVSRNWTVEQLGQDFSILAKRWRVVAARASNDMPDKGAIICACMNVGLNEIAEAVQAGCHSVEAIGASTTAGTNCGSCISELRIILNEHTIIAAE